jgi:hypothetical protein
LAAKDFIQDLYVHMGFQAPTSYEKVIELTIEFDIIVSTQDMSKIMKSWRNQIIEEDEELEDIQKWIEEKFSRKY